MPASPDLFLRLRSVTRELGLPVPAVSSLLDLAVDGSGEALARLFALAPLARGADRDEQLAALLSDGLVEVGEASADEMLAALRIASTPHAQAAIELVAAGLEQAGTDATRYPLVQTLRRTVGQPDAPEAQTEGWLAVLEHRPVRSAEVVAQSPAVTAASVAPAPAPAPPLPAAARGAPNPSALDEPGRPGHTRDRYEASGGRMHRAVAGVSGRRIVFVAAAGRLIPCCWAHRAPRRAPRVAVFVRPLC